MGNKYYLKSAWLNKWTEVTLEQYCAAERNAGFRPKPGCGPTATASFSSGNTHGKVVYCSEEAT